MAGKLFVIMRDWAWKFFWFWNGFSLWGDPLLCTIFPLPKWFLFILNTPLWNQGKSENLLVVHSHAHFHYTTILKRQKPSVSRSEYLSDYPTSGLTPHNCTTALLIGSLQCVLVQGSWAGAILFDHWSIVTIFKLGHVWWAVMRDTTHTEGLMINVFWLSSKTH